MFTGIIEETGTIHAILCSSNASSITVNAKKILEDLSIGDSIAVNGVCLTVHEFGKSDFTADVMPETVHCTSLSLLRFGSHVNLERAMRNNGRFGGHIVTGHIDGTGTITAIRRDANAIRFYIRAENKIMQNIIEKGSIAVDGISLTVATLTSCEFCVSVIPHTLEVTNLGTRKIGDKVNLENDCIGKYVKKQMEGMCDDKSKFC